MLHFLLVYLVIQVMTDNWLQVLQLILKQLEKTKLVLNCQNNSNYRQYIYGLVLNENAITILKYSIAVFTLTSYLQVKYLFIHFLFYLFTSDSISLPGSPKGLVSDRILIENKTVENRQQFQRRNASSVRVVAQEETSTTIPRNGLYHSEPVGRKQQTAPEAKKKSARPSTDGLSFIYLER